MKLWFCVLAVTAVSVIGGGSQEAQAGHGCRAYYSYYRYSVPYIYPVVRQTAVIYTYPTAPVIIETPAPLAPTIVLPSKQLKVPQGSKIRLKANFLGNETGHVFLAVGSVTLECAIQEWNPQFVILQLPKAGILRDTSAKLVIATRDGDVKRRVDVILSPTTDVDVIPDGEFIPRAPKELFGDF